MIAHTSQAGAQRAWLLSAARGAVALTVGIAVVFIQDHSSLIGLGTAAVLFACMAVAMAALSSKAGPARRGVLTGAAIHAAGAVASVALLMAQAGPVPLLILLLVWALASGLVELATARLAAQSHIAAARDWRFVALVTLGYVVLLAISPLLGIADPVSLTGFLGAYAAIIGVFLLIGAASAALGTKATQSEVQS